MNTKNALIKRLFASKLTGFIIGGLSFFLMPMLGAELTLYFGLGMWLFFILMGVMIGFMGLMTHHPIFKFRMPFWLRGGLVGGVMYLMMILLSYDAFLPFMQLEYVRNLGISSPFWAILDGILIGIVMDYIATRYGGEGALPLA